MSDFLIRDKCKINTNKENDTFVGIKCENGDYSVHFPVGFHISENDRDLRKEIIMLMAIIKSTTGKKESTVYSRFKDDNYVCFPFQAYLAVIFDFYNRGYYKEREVTYNISKKGKIDWSRTVKLQKPIIQDEEAYYLDFVVKKNTINQNELITLIHEYCVYDSFLKLGWLFTDYLPMFPRVKYHYRLFKNVLTEKISNTFNDQNRELFKNMLAIIENLGSDAEDTDYKFGTNRFEYVWEKMIDCVFGIKNKEWYFPRTMWKLDKDYNNACLEPDSILIYDNKIYILDAKYYKYGQTKKPSDLPESSSINKQITYGEYIATNSKFDDKHGKDRRVYNAFLMPFDSLSALWNTDKDILYIGEAVSDWKHGANEYEHIHGILVDVKSLMNAYLEKDAEKISMLVNCIEDAIKESRG